MEFPPPLPSKFEGVLEKSLKSLVPPPLPTVEPNTMLGYVEWISCVPGAHGCMHYQQGSYVLNVITGVHRKLDMANEDGNKMDKSLKTTKQQKYRPPGKDSPTSMNKGRTGSVRGVSDKLANMAVGARRQSMGAPPMKAGGHWITEPRNYLLRPTQDIPAARAYSRKVAG